MSMVDKIEQNPYQLHHKSEC